MEIPPKEELVAALKAAGSAHHDYETHVLSGERDMQWPGWYAAYVLGRVGDFITPSQLAHWLSEAPASNDWARTAAEYIALQKG